MNGQNIIVFDLETKSTFDEVGGRDNFAALGISVLGAYDYRIGKYVIYEEGELSRFIERLQHKPLLVGFNSRKFDCAVLQPHVPFDLGKLPQLDIMEELVKALGHRVSLDSVASATLGSTKTGHGLDAIRYFRNGEMEKLKSYCLEDVKLTHRLYEYGAQHGELFFTSKFGNTKSRAPVAWKVEHPEEPAGAAVQGSLF